MTTGTEFPTRIPPQEKPDDLMAAARIGTIFVLGPEGGYAVPPRRYTLLFGRDRDSVHVPIGTDDPDISRKHGVFTCAGPDGEWWLRNTGRRVIELPDGIFVLEGHERLIEPGHTPMRIHSSNQRSHSVDVHVVGAGDCGLRSISSTSAPTVPPRDVYELDPQERLVLTVLAKRYLEGLELHPLPLTWEQTAEYANASPSSTKCWTHRTVANTVDKVRDRLHRLGVRGLTREEVGEPVGGTLSQNLIRELIKSATLEAQDLRLLGEIDAW